jgi:hypothetical protein
METMFLMINRQDQAFRVQQKNFICGTMEPQQSAVFTLVIVSQRFETVVCH